MRIDRLQIRLTLIVLLGAAVFGVGLWWPTIRQINQVRDQIAQAQEDLVLNRARSEGLAQLAREVEQLRQDVESRHKVIPQQAELAGLLRELSLQIEAAKLTGQGISTMPTVVGKDYVALPVELTFRGDSLSIFRFIRHIEQMPRLMQIESLQMSSVPTGDDQSSSRPGRRDDPGAPALQATLRLTTYFSPAEEGKS